jgi:hypothetical protein
MTTWRKFVDQKWKDSLNEAAAEPASADYGADFKRNAVDNLEKGDTERFLDHSPHRNSPHGQLAPSKLAP